MELQETIANVSRLHESQYQAGIPRIDGPRALLRARLNEASMSGAPAEVRHWRLAAAWLLAAAACLLLVAGLQFFSRLRPGWRSGVQTTATVVPNPRLTPGATLLVTTQELCAHTGPNNKAVPVALQRQVFEQYGLRNAEMRSYEVDYLITPALGGADDIHNLWPHSYFTPLWNAWVKDALEDKLRDMVCEGSLDLHQAQQDIATNWIEAYKKYFHTDRPLREHLSAGGNRRDF